jgi:DNA-binding response OmpR family regulator
MIPVRVLVVEDSRPLLRSICEELEAADGFEVITAGSPAAGMLTLARLQPDLLILDPFAGGGTPEEWNRTVARYRNARPLSVLVLADRLSDRDRGILETLADLGIQARYAISRITEAVLTAWAESAEPLSEAA